MNDTPKFNSFNFQSAELASGRLRRRVYGLLVNPIIPCSDGRFRLPPIQRSSLDFASLGAVLGGLFGRYGDVCMRIPNDYVDVRTFDERSDAFTSAMQIGEAAPDLHFKDFGSIVRRRAVHHTNGVIDVQNQFDKHCGGPFGDRLIFPPEIIPMLVVGRNEQEIAIWFLGALDHLGIYPLTNIARAFSGKPPVEIGPIGRLPTPIANHLHEMFKLPFEDKAAIINMTA